MPLLSIMNTEQLHDLINSDNLKEALEAMLHLFPAGNKSRTIRALYGRLADLNNQNNMGTISSEAFNLEKNKIRAAILSIVDNNDMEISKPKGSGISKYLIAGLVMVLATIGIFSFGTNLRKKTNQNLNSSTQNEANIIPQRQTEPQQNESAPKLDFAEMVRNKIGKEPFSLKFATMGLSEIREFKTGLAFLKRKFNWEAEINLEVDASDISVNAASENPKAIAITVKKVALSPAIFVTNKNANTIVNSLWLEETSKDGEFWESVNIVTKYKVNQLIKGNPAQLSNIKDILEKRLGRTTSDLTGIQLSLNIEKLELYNGEIQNF